MHCLSGSNRHPNLLHTLLLLALVTTSVQATATDTDNPWKLKRDKQGIQVFTRSVPGSKFKAVQAKMKVEATVTELAALVLDTKACADWADLCKEARVHEQISATEFYVYTYNNIPWPVSDRDALAHVKWSQDPETFAVDMSAEATDGILDKTKGAVRLTHANTGWKFTPTDNGRVEVTMRAHVDPAGPTPAWLTNMLLVDSPFKTMKNMRKVIEQGDYRGVSVDFIQEPGAIAQTDDSAGPDTSAASQ